MSTRSERLSNAVNSAATNANVSTTNALNEMFDTAMEAYTVVHHVHTFVKEHTTSHEETRDAIASLMQVLYAIEDAHEFKTRQLMGDKVEQAMAGHRAFMKDLRTLTKEAEDIAAVFSQHQMLSPSLILSATNLGTDIVPTFYTN
jgi:hypothetical protein